MVKKKSHEEEIRRGAAALREQGVATDDASPASVTALQERFGQGRETDLAIVFTLGRIADPAAVEALAALDRQSADKEIKKEIRRAFFKLSQRGLDVPREKPSAEGAAARVFDRGPEIEAYMSSVDGAGGRLVWVVKPQPNQGLQVIQAMVGDRDGLQRIGGAHVSRKELRAMTQEIQKQHGVTMISVPWRYADEMIYEAFEKAKALGRSGLENFHELRSIINSAKPELQQHPVYAKLDADHAREGAWREQSRRLLDEPELRFWILDDDFLRPFVEELQAAQASRLVLNPVQKEERLAAIVRDAVKALCAGAMGTAMQRRMEDMALYFFETRRPEAARLALGLALQIKDGDPGPLDISFFTGLVQKSVAYVSQAKSKSEEESSLIIKP